jgi:hypothetical protein
VNATLGRGAPRWTSRSGCRTPSAGSTAAASSNGHAAPSRPASPRWGRSTGSSSDLRLGDYYAFLGDYAQQIVQSAATDEETVKAYLAGFEEAGADEAICFPTTPDPDQVELLARAAGV